MTTLAITLKDEHRKFIDEAMRSGRYVSESEVVAEALAELKAREQLHESRLAELRKEVQLGLQQLEAGEGVEWNVETLKARARSLVREGTRE